MYGNTRGYNQNNVTTDLNYKSMQDNKRYMMIVDGNTHFLLLRETAQVYDSGWVPVEFGDLVLLEDFTTVVMTDEDKQKISRLADDYSASK